MMRTLWVDNALIIYFTTKFMEKYYYKEYAFNKSFILWQVK